MKKPKLPLSFLIAISLLSLSCGERAGNTAGFVISGQVTGADGKPPVLAHAHLTTIDGSYSKPILSHELDAEGTFSMKLDSSGAYRIWVSAADHETVGIPVILEGRDTEVEMNIDLALNPFVQMPEDIKIFGSWNDFSWKEAATMEKQDDGSFLFETEVSSDTVAYQLLNVVSHGHSVNGTQHDFLEYDGGGDYRSVVIARDGRVRIRFDPAALPEASGDNKAGVSFDKSNRHLADLFEIDTRVNEVYRDYNEAFNTFTESQGSSAGFEYPFTPIHAFLKEKIDRGPALIAQYAALNLPRFYYFDDELDAETYDLILETVPANSEYWKLALTETAYGLTLLNREKAESWLQDIITYNPDRTAKAMALCHLTFLARLDNKAEKVSSLYSTLTSEYSDVAAIRYQIAKMNPDGPVAIGKQVPAFSLESLDGTAMVSTESLTGRYYLVDFWATWCKPCVREMPGLHEVYEAYKDRDFTIVSLSLDNNTDVIHEFREKNWQMPWKHAFLDDGWNSKVVSDFGVEGIPSPFLVGPDGTILATHMMLRGRYLQHTLNKFLEARRDIKISSL